MLVSAVLPPWSQERLDIVAFSGLVVFSAALPFSIAVAQIFLTLALVLWGALLLSRREPPEVPAFFWPLVAYAALTILSSAFSDDPRESFVDSKELALFLIVPAVATLVRGRRTDTIATVIVTFGAASALFGIFQYGILEYDNLGRRPQGTMGHYMTYSGLLMLVTCVAAARLLFGRRERVWPGLVLPALLVALTLTFTRSAWIGACVGVGALLVLRDLRLLAVLPVVAALFFALAPPAIASRLYSVFDLQDPTNRDRLAMTRAGVRMIRDHPLMGVGPEMVLRTYPEYRDSGAVKPVNPHLHNVPLQIAAERGLPALAAWLWFIGVLGRDLTRKFKAGEHPWAAAAGIAAIGAMLTAGFFEYNFGDSEFLMLFLVIITLPYAAEGGPASATP